MYNVSTVCMTIPVKPRTKKNHSNIVTLKNGKTILLPSKQYREFEKEVLDHIATLKINGFNYPIQKECNLKCVFYKDKNYKSDLMGYMQAIADVLVKANILADDNSTIVASTDGSAVFLDRNNPRIEITITSKIGGLFD